MKRDTKFAQVLRSINHFLVVFLLVAFVITCCMMLFVSIMSQTLGVTLTGDNLSTAAKLTFANVVFLSLVFTVIDMVRRKLTVDRPVKKITDAAEKMMQGDFNIRIAPTRSFQTDDKFNEIIDCFNKMAEQLSGTETLSADFIANVSHEIKTPLAVMQNYGTLLTQPNISEEKRLEYARAVTAASRRLADLVSNILKLNKLENQQIVPSCKIYDLGEQLCECLLGFEEVWEKKELEIDTDIEDCVLVKSDAEMLSLVWNNLFSNAIKFTKKGGKISLSLKTEGDTAVVKISDTGCGISKEVGTRMFDKFYQGDTSHGSEGNGLGLALVKRVIDITESDISVESELNRGSTFTVRIRREKGGGI